MTAIQWVVPPSTLRWLEDIPRDQPVAMLIRHSVRDHLPSGEVGYELPITEVGHQLATELGSLLGQRLRSIHASPLLRTMQTGRCLGTGAGLSVSVKSDRLLGDPGVFVVDGRAGETWGRLGHEEVMRQLVEGRTVLPGCAAAEPAARFLVHHMLSQASGAPGIHTFVTHDSLVTATMAHLMGKQLGVVDWPWYLEAAFFWERDGDVHCAYRHWHAIRPVPLVELSEDDVVGLARREVAATVGLDCPARFFLAGGAFKTLLTGRAPRDLDLWAPSAHDRAILEAALRRRGATPLLQQPYTQGFCLGDRIIELPLRTDPDTLEERLVRFDLALSAIGAEHCPGDQWRAVIHPLAHQSVSERRVLLLDELLNWRHCLTSLERLRRYSAELGYLVPVSEEERIWRIFQNQSGDVQAAMVERYQISARHDQGVAEEIARRRR